MGKTASDATWALLAEGVADARLRVQNVDHMVSKFVQVCRHPRHKEIMAKLFGDLLQALPESVEQAERALDRTGYALSKLGEDRLKETLSLEDRAKVEQGLQNPKHGSVDRLAARYLNARG